MDISSTPPSKTNATPCAATEPPLDMSSLISPAWMDVLLGKIQSMIEHQVGLAFAKHTKGLADNGPAPAPVRNDPPVTGRPSPPIIRRRSYPYTRDGRPICVICNGVNHIARNCFARFDRNSRHVSSARFRPTFVKPASPVHVRSEVGAASPVVPPKQAEPVVNAKPSTSTATCTPKLLLRCVDTQTVSQKPQMASRFTQMSLPKLVSAVTQTASVLPQTVSSFTQTDILGEPANTSVNSPGALPRQFVTCYSYRHNCEVQLGVGLSCTMCSISFTHQDHVQHCRGCKCWYHSRCFPRSGGYCNTCCRNRNQ